jgi:hypothetical protein
MKITPAREHNCVIKANSMSYFKENALKTATKNG